MKKKQIDEKETIDAIRSSFTCCKVKTHVKTNLTQELRLFQYLTQYSG